MFPNLLNRSRHDAWMSVPIALRCQTEDKCDKDEADSSFLFRCKDKNVAPDTLRGHGGMGGLKLLRKLHC